MIGGAATAAIAAIHPVDGCTATSTTASKM
jgi:hypothetical protein